MKQEGYISLKTKNKKRNPKQRNLLTTGAVIVLVITALSGIAVQKKTERICSEAERLLAVSEEYVLAGDFAQAELAAGELKDFWAEQIAYLGFFYEHDAANRIAEGIARLCVLAVEDAEAAFAAEAETLKAQLKVLSEYDTVNAVNII